jgi:F-type H+-transporting ATPase subunit alpha
VGGSAQIKAMKQVAGTLRLEMAQYREKAAFAQFGSDLDPATQRQIARGKRLTEILKQAQYAPMSAEAQVMIIYAGTHGYLDKVPENRIREYEEQLFSFLDRKYPEVLKEIATSGKLDDAMKTKMNGALKDFEAVFTA